MTVLPSAEQLHSLTEEALVKDWLDLLRLGPRFHGSDAEKQARGLLLDRLRSLPLKVREHPYEFPSWELKERPRVVFTAPDRVEVDAMAFIHCAPTPAGGLRGRLRLLGTHWVIRCFDWMRFGIVDDDERLIGYVSARPDGPAIPQTLDRDSAVVPHFIVGKDAYLQLRQWSLEEQEIRIEGTIDCRGGDAEGSANVIASHEPAGTAPFRVVVCAHLDSMWGCPGANDNGGGVTAVLGLARAISEMPLPFAVDFLWVTGEEWDLAGSRAYVSSLSDEEIKQIRLVLNLDGIAETGENLQIWSSSEGLEYEVIQCVRDHDAAAKRSPGHSYTFPPRLGTDHVPFQERGCSVLSFTGFEMERYHTPQDVFRPELGANLEYVALLAWRLLSGVGIDVDGPMFTGRARLSSVRSLGRGPER